MKKLVIIMLVSVLGLSMLGGCGTVKKNTSDISSSPSLPAAPVNTIINPKTLTIVETLYDSAAIGALSSEEYTVLPAAAIKPMTAISTTTNTRTMIFEAGQKISIQYTANLTASGYPDAQITWGVEYPNQKYAENFLYTSSTNSVTLPNIDMTDNCTLNITVQPMYLRK